MEISHDRAEETPEGKARWFQSLTIHDRMNLLVEFCDLALSGRPGLSEAPRAEPPEARILVLGDP
jgi:hypothetical protein